MESIKELQGRIEAKTRAARNVLAEMGANPTAVQAAIYDALLDDADRTKAILDQMAPGSPNEPAMKAWARERDDLDFFVRNGDSLFGRRARNTTGTVVPSQGGYTVGPLVANDIMSVLKGYGWMRQVASEITTSSGAAMGYPTSDGTLEVGERLAENATAAASDPNFGTASLNTTKYSSMVITVPLELLQDASADIVGFIMQRATDRIGRIQNLDFTLGNGVTQPTGLVTAAAVGKTAATGQTTSFLFDDLSDMIESVNEAALGMPSKQPGVPPRNRTGWMFNQTVRSALRKIKDSTGRPIWVPGIGAELPQLLDYPVFINNDMAVPAANAKTIAFGALARYMIRDALEVTLYRFADSAYTMKGQVGFLALARAGGNLLDTSAVRLFQQSAT